ncbi:MAG: YlmH/Sll1252 family protein [Candidatus Pristimantibacillus lignocellulolyticus]|uniref:YlmH/Sll1252 family protein n=1 Tax=Candidatus Pristimantibacillus lignocellulolyticus TaxID=2994561 RepID=A0A9J6ZB07_9BACL|nr:MAG: YlmH/Sll1252 family protein [Candidatus Pristimantibacillus lignocellulolyticus]
MKDGFYSHFHPEEKPFVDRAQEWIERSAELHELRRTDFLDPRQQFIVTTIANRIGSVNIKFDGGYDDAERKRAIIVPDYRDVEYEDADLKVLQVTSQSDKFHELDHGDFLGALIGLGIKRDRVGDIHQHDDFCHIVVTSEMAQFLDIGFRQVHRLNVLTDIISIEQLQPVVAKFEELSFTVASLRLDGIASDAYRVSRTKIVDPIKAGRCRVNWRTEEDPSKQLKEGDVVSIKGMGRFKVAEVDGVTKKGRIRVKISKFI